MLSAVLLAVIPLATSHPNSLSSSRLSIEGHDAHLVHRCQVASLLEVIEGLDADGDGKVTEAEVAARSGAILGYIGEHYVLKTGTDRDLTGGVRLEPQPRTARFVPLEDRPSGFRDWVDVEIDYRAGEPITDALVEVTVFWDTSPDHIDYTTIEWADGSTVSFAIDRYYPRARFDPSGRGALRAFVIQGWRHILSGWDHQAFLLALVLASRRLRSLVGVVTAFTVAHSVTLALAALGVIDVSEWSVFIEQAIALSIAYVATDTLLHPQLDRSRWPETFLFGLVHGMGFAGFLGESLIAESSKGVALFGFNLGVELGQLAIVLVLALVLRLIPRRGNQEERFLAPTLLRRVGSGVVALLGLFWFVQRL